MRQPVSSSTPIGSNRCRQEASWRGGKRRRCPPGGLATAGPLPYRNNAMAPPTTAASTVSRRGSGRPRRRCRDPVKDFPLGRLHLGDLDGELVDTLPHQIETGWSSRDHFFSRRIAVGLPSQGGGYADEKRDQVAGEGEWG